MELLKEAGIEGKSNMSVLDEEELKNLYKKGCPSYFEYLKTKMKSFVLKGEEKQSNKEKYQSIRQQRKIYKKLTERVKQNGKG